MEEEIIVINIKAAKAAEAALKKCYLSIINRIFFSTAATAAKKHGIKNEMINNYIRSHTHKH